MVKGRALVVVLALILATLATAGVFLYARGVEEDAKAGGTMVSVVVSEVDIPPRTDLNLLIKDDLFRVIQVNEAAYVDGANRLRTWWSVVMPLAGPAVATLGIITFLGIWNDYLWPLVTCEGSGCTLQSGLRNLQNQYTRMHGRMQLITGLNTALLPTLGALAVAASRAVASASG